MSLTLHSVSYFMLLNNAGCDPLNRLCTPLLDHDQHFEKHLTKAFWTEGEACEKLYTKMKSQARTIEFVSEKGEDPEGIPETV